MPYVNLILRCPAAHAEALSDALGKAGARAVSLVDAAAGTPSEQAIFGEPGMPQEALWEQCEITALVDDNLDAAALVQAAARTLGLATTPAWRAEPVADADWVRLTQSQFAPIAISPRLWIVPTWHQAPDATAINIRLDPGVAFGTGSHPTTRLCLQWLDTHLMPGETVIDYGCGSGILAIAAMKLGAAAATGIDIDPQAVAAARDNARANGVAIHFAGTEERVAAPADLLVANILANPLRALAPLLAGLVRPEGRLVLAGILSEQRAEMIAHYATWFDLSAWAHDEGWVCLAGPRRHAGAAA